MYDIGYIVYENRKGVVYVEVLNVIYRILESAMLWHKNFRKDLEEIEFKFNPYDPCIANIVVKGNKHTIRFHVDYLMSSYVDKNE